MASGHDVFLTRVRSCDTTSALGYLAPLEFARSRRVQNKKEAATRQLPHEFSEAWGNLSFR